MHRSLVLLTNTPALVASSVVSARTTCYSDAQGNTTCRDSSGSIPRSYADSYGNTVCR